MSGIEGQPPRLSPELKATYTDEFKRGVDLFRRSLNEYQSTDAGPKKDKFKEVMDEALEVINDTAKAILSSHSQKTAQLQKDYQDLIAGSPNAYQALSKDIENLKKSV
jgi:Skp family chaperone for outer membrane proteins